MNNDDSMVNEILQTLENPATIRKQAHHLLTLAKQDKLNYFGINTEQMAATASYIIEVITQNYPDMNVPYHSRWRHFEAGDKDRIKRMISQLNGMSSDEKGVILYELIIISVFLDAGAGALWQYKDKPTGKIYTRSEGLALASLSMYLQGAFSSRDTEPLRVDAARLIHFSEKDLFDGFQITTANPLEGVSGRVHLLNQLGILLKEKPQYFGQQARLGDFYLYISSLQTDNTLSVSTIFHAVLSAFNGIWPARLSYQGISLGDVWIHSALKSETPGSEFIPFHKLSQWLVYSLIEPLEQSGIHVTDLDTLTGLPEYRNGGLLIDTQLLRVKNKKLLLTPQEPGSEAIVEWRALTVALLDELAILIRKELKQDIKSLPLAKILQGGTWEAGRRIAKEKRVDGTPPIQIISDGTIF